MANDNRINDKTYQVGKFVDVREVTTLTSTATVNLDFTEPKEWTLTATQATVFNITGTYETGDTVWVHVTGDYTMSFIQSTFTFYGNLTAGLVNGYNGLKYNYIGVKCIDATNKKFRVVCQIDLNN